MSNAAGANQVANSKASAGIFINLALGIYIFGFIFKWAKKLDPIREVMTDEIMQVYRAVMMAGSLFLLIGLSRTIGTQYDLTRFLILALMFALNIFFDEVYERVMEPAGKNKNKNKKNKKD